MPCAIIVLLNVTAFHTRSVNTLTGNILRLHAHAFFYIRVVINDDSMPPSRLSLNLVEITCPLFKYTDDMICFHLPFSPPLLSRGAKQPSFNHFK